MTIKKLGENIYLYQNEKDKRFRVVYKDENGKIHTKSYPKYLVENELGRPLNPNEEIHHLDGDVTNNNLENLKIVIHGEHQREHSRKYFDKIEVCYYCGKEFLWTAKQQRNHFSNLSRKNRHDSGYVFCSKRCAGKYWQEEKAREKMQPNDYSFDYYYGGDILKVNDQGEVEVMFPEHYSMEVYTMSRPKSTATSSSKTINPPYFEELPNLPNQYPNEAPKQDPSYGGLSGWVCPKCGRVYSPFTPMCYYCGSDSYPGQIVFTCGPSSSGDTPPLASTSSPKTVSKSNL